jgi:hypothetical protein
MPTLNFAKLLLALAGVTLLILAAAACADADTGGLARVRQAIATVDARAASSGAPSEERSENATGATAAAVSAAQATLAASASDAPQGNASAPSSDQGVASSPSEASGTPVTPPQPAAPADEEPVDSAPSAPAPGASTTSISAAVQEAIGQAASASYGSGGGADGTIAAESNATTQLIWQVQISECTTHCSDTEQYQAAEQQSTTHQALAGAPPAATAIGAQATGEPSQATASVTQVQLGCVSHCLGTTTTTSGAAITANIQQAVEALLHQIAASLPGLSPTPAVDQNAVEQISFELQSQADGSLAQTQSVSQASTTTQEYDASSSALIGDLESALSGPQAASYEAVNQTEQGIWQLQIGCLMFCEETEQYQQAEQSNTTLQTVASRPDANSSTPATLANTAAQLIWQAQIGCLMWCVDAHQQQSAAAENTLALTESQGSGATPPVETTSPPPSKGAEPAPAPSLGQGGAASGPTPPLAPPAAPAPPVLRDVALVGLTSPTVVSKPRPKTRRSHISTARASTSPVRGSQAVIRPESAAAHAHLRRGLASHRAVGPAPASFGAVTAEAKLGSREPSDPGMPTAGLLAAIALCGLCCLGIAALRARQGSLARHAEN